MVSAMSAAATPRLPARTIRRYAAGSLATGGFATLPGLVLVYYLTDTLGVGVLFAGLVVMLAKIWDVLIDPVVGALSDRNLAQHGSRRRLMFAGAAILPLAFVLTFAVPHGVGPELAGAWVTLAFMLAATGFSCFQVPYVTLPAEITPSYDERTRLLTWRVVVLAAAILLFGAGGPALRGLAGGGQRGYLAMAFAAAFALLAGMLVAIGSTPTHQPVATTAGREPRRLLATAMQHYRGAAAVLRASQPFRALLGAYLLQSIAIGEMLAAASYVATWLFHDENMVTLLFVALIGPALPCTPLWGAWAQRIGKERGYRAASVLFLFGVLALGGLFVHAGQWVYGPIAACGIAYAAMQALPMAMLPDVISADARQHGTERAGAFGGVWAAVETAGFAIGAGLTAMVLATTGYRAHVSGAAVAQSAAALDGIALAFSALPAALVALSLLPLRHYRLRREDLHA